MLSRFDCKQRRHRHVGGSWRNYSGTTQVPGRQFCQAPYGFPRPLLQSLVCLVGWLVRLALHAELTSLLSCSLTCPVNSNDLDWLFTCLRLYRLVLVRSLHSRKVLVKFLLCCLQGYLVYIGTPPRMAPRKWLPRFWTMDWSGYIIAASSEVLYKAKFDWCVGSWAVDCW